MFPGLALSLLLTVPPVSGESRAALEARAAIEARAELESCAERIEALKATRRPGATSRELERLLVRAQELAAALQRARVDLDLPPPVAAPSPEELRERADAARDEADRLAAEIAVLDVKLEDLRRVARAEGDPAVAQAFLGGRLPSRAAARLRELQLRRATLAEERARAEHAAAGLEAEARAAEEER